MNNEQLRPSEVEPKPKYYLTWDVPMLINGLCDYKGWIRPDPTVFENGKSEIIQTISNKLPDVPVIVIDAEKIREEIESAVGKAKSVLDLPVVSMDPIYGNSVADYSLNTTRGLNADGTITEIPRPGYPPIESQLALLSEYLGDKREIYVVDAGAYSGNTLVELIEKLKEKGITVNSVILGVATKEAKQTLQNQGISSVILNNINKPVDWIEARDFVPFTPLCGRVLNEPFVQGTLSRAIPYGGPSVSFETMTDWASLPWNSWFCVSLRGYSLAEAIYTAIEKANSITITFNDLVDLPIRIGYPLFEPYVNGNYSVVDSLKSDINEIWEIASETIREYALRADENAKKE